MAEQSEPREASTARLPRAGKGVSVDGALLEVDPPRSRPLDAADLDKFARLGRVSRICDNGSIIIYDVRGLSHASG